MRGGLPTHSALAGTLCQIALVGDIFEGHAFAGHAHAGHVVASNVIAGNVSTDVA